MLCRIQCALIGIAYGREKMFNVAFPGLCLQGFRRTYIREYNSKRVIKKVREHHTRSSRSDSPSCSAGSQAPDLGVRHLSMLGVRPQCPLKRRCSPPILITGQMDSSTPSIILIARGIVQHCNNILNLRSCKLCVVSHGHSP